MKRLDLTGKTFENCQVIDYKGQTIHSKSQWNCVCDCGNQFVALGAELNNGHTKSCGCYSRSGTFTTIHGYRSKQNATKQHPLYTLWVNIKERCLNPNHPHFDDYGGRGITVCQEWSSSFQTFVDYILETLGEKPPVPDNIEFERYWSIDRIDNNKGYEPDNVKWSDPVSQKINQRPRRWWKKPKEAVI